MNLLSHHHWSQALRTALLLFAFFAITACGQTTEPNTTNTAPEDPVSDSNLVLLTTSLGDITLELDFDNAPNTSANFVSYVKNGHYDGTLFHRVIPGFMIQGGGFEVGMQQKSVGAPISNEANNGLKNNRFSIAMARTNDPHSATAQFFINTVNNDFLNFSSETPQGWGYAVFGKVVAGTEVVEQIELVRTQRVGPHGDVPINDVIIVSATMK